MADDDNIRFIYLIREKEKELESNSKYIKI